MNTYKVKLTKPKSRMETVHADYHKIDNGVLTFRSAPVDGGYPGFICCYAEGSWASVYSVWKGAPDGEHDSR